MGVGEGRRRGAEPRPAEANGRLAQAEQAVADTIKQAYRWILNPHQEFGSKDIEIETIPMDGDGTLAARATAKARSSEFVMSQYAASLLRGQIDRLHLWDQQPHIAVETVAGYFTQYLYMPRITSHDVIRGSVRALDNVLLRAQDGIAYADSWDPEAGRYRGLALDDVPRAVSNSGLIVDHRAAQEQIDREKAEDLGGGGGSTGGGGAGGGAEGTETTKTRVVGPGGGVTVGPTRASRFHATKAIDPRRAVRDMSGVSDDILALLTTNGAAVKVTIDIESDMLARLSEDQVTAPKENLTTLGFRDWNVE